MAPNSPCFNYHLDNHAVYLQQQNSCSQQINSSHQRSPYGSWMSVLAENHLKLVKEKFAAVNSYYFKENYVEPVDNFSSNLSAVGVEAAGQNKWLREMRWFARLRLESMRQAMVQQIMNKKVEIWQKKKTEMLRNKKHNVSFKPKFQRSEILIKKENYKLILEQIQKHSQTEQTVTVNPEQRCREICYNATMKKAISLFENVSNEVKNKQFQLSIDTYKSLESRINILKNVQVIEESSLIATYSLLNDLTLFNNNVVKTNQTKTEVTSTKIDNKRNPLRKFSINIPDKSVIKNVKRQFVALVKNNDALIKNLIVIENVPFATDPTTKLQRHNIIKVINTLVNTISSSSPAHLTEKYTKLNALLSGRFICVANTNVMVGQNKEAQLFCMDTLAKKFISHAEEVLSVKAQAAFEMAAVAVKLWSNHSDFGKILFSKIKQKCPILVPFCCRAMKIANFEQLNYQLLGYKVDLAGNIENQEKYLKRMTGIIRLYAALIISSLRCDQPVLGLAHAWTLVAGVLNKNPIVDITPTLLVEFLQIAGFAMHQTYKNQFMKLLQYMNNNYINKIQLITPPGCGGPVTRLKNMVMKCLESRSISEPIGLLPSEFW
ncbi:mRNA export factor Gle1-like [Adelges cooleyi]|uniref:mRNA export factor Gle1-like n=1 Tax=Adelges cooleyi TaxID=133065 RepID=UPI00217F33B4|nr:mRNA export factor Gle1-like [Adelges cooleyi]